MALPCDSRPQHIFADIMHFASPSLRSQLDAERSPYGFQHILTLCLEPGAVLDSAPCKLHGGAHCRHARAVNHRSGSPCTDFTSWGAGRKLSGPTVFPLAIWIALRILLRETWIVIENVAAWPLEIVMSVLSRYYDVSFTLVDNESFAGMCVQRVRKYMVLTLRTLVTLTRPLTDMPSSWGRRRASNFTWQSLRNVGPGELKSELLWSRSRRCDKSSLPPLPDDPALWSRDVFASSLLDTEQERLSYFTEHHPEAASGMCYLSQDPKFIKAVGGCDGCLQTIVTACHLCWVEEWGRWMTARELLLAQGFPVVNEVLAAVHKTNPDLRDAEFSQLPALTSSNQSRTSLRLPPRNRVAMTKQAGNTMSIPVIGAVLMWAHMYLRPAVPALPPQVSGCATGGPDDDDSLDNAAVGPAANRLARWMARRSGKLPTSVVDVVDLASVAPPQRKRLQLPMHAVCQSSPSSRSLLSNASGLSITAAPPTSRSIRAGSDFFPFLRYTVNPHQASHCRVRQRFL